MKSFSRKENNWAVDKMRVWALGGLLAEVRIQSCLTVVENNSKKRDNKEKILDLNDTVKWF